MKKNVVRRNSKCVVNHDFFKIWSHDMAYVLGLWWADGYISIGKSYLFGITLEKNDGYLLQKILSIMKSTHLLYKNKNTLSIGICSKTIVEDIIGLGGEARKSLVATFPYVPHEYMPDFIRGVFDGDGSVFPLKYRKGYESNFVSGSEKFITSLKKELESSILGFTTRFEKKYSEKYRKNYYFLSLSSNNTRRLRDFMYYDNCELKMDRKYEKHIANGSIKLSVSDKTFLPYEKAMLFLETFPSLKTTRQWYKYFHDNIEKMVGLPNHPEKIYKKYWNGWSCWLGQTGKYFYEEKHENK